MTDALCVSRSGERYCAVVLFPECVCVGGGGGSCSDPPDMTETLTGLHIAQWHTCQLRPDPRLAFSAEPVPECW